MRHISLCALAVVISGVAAAAQDLSRSSVLTQHNDKYRTGSYLTESVLTPNAVATHGLQISYVRPVDGAINTQLLYTPSLPIGPRAVDVVFAATTNGTVYAFDANVRADSGTEEGLLWRTSLRGHGESQDPGRAYGVHSTPVIDLNEKTLYVVTRTQENDTDEFWLSALDIRNGNIVRQTKIAVPGFNAASQNQRPALLLDRAMIYIGFGMFGDEGCKEYHGWVLRYNAQSFVLAGSFNANPTRATCQPTCPPTKGGCPTFLGAGVWQGGGGLAADDNGDVYAMTGNGPYNPSALQFGDSFIKLGIRNGSWGLVDHFAPRETDWLYKCDLDISSGAPLLIQGGDRLVGGGKTGTLYVLNTSNLQSSFQWLVGGVDQYRDASNLCHWEGGPHLHGSPAFWHGSAGDYVYIWAEQDYLRRFAFRVDGSLDPAPMTGNVLGPVCLDSGLKNDPQPPQYQMCPMPGGMLSISANGQASGILWSTLPINTGQQYWTPAGQPPPGQLLAYDAETMKLLWRQDLPSPFFLGKWTPPTIADGKVFIATTPPVGINGQFIVYELGPPVGATIWSYTGTPCSGAWCPGWRQLDNNPATVAIVGGRGNLYQLHDSGKIWGSTGVGCSFGSCPGWQMLDENTATVQIAADSSNLYQLHNTGKIWHYTGTPCSGTSCPGWQMLDENTATVGIAAGGGQLYQLHTDGSIWRYTGTPCSGTSCPGWQMLDENTATVGIAAGGGQLYQLHTDGSIWRYTGTACSGTSCPGWQMLDNNTATVAIAAGNQLYQMHVNGSIWSYTGSPCTGTSCPGWQMLDNNIKAVAIAAADDQLYEMHNDGMIWRYTGTPCKGRSCPGWQMLDDNPLTGMIAAADNLYQLHTDPVYQLHDDGSLWRYSGTPCYGDFCPGWAEVDDNSRTVAIAAAGNQLFQLHADGSIWRHNGTTCSSSSCPGWIELDNNPQTAAIVAGGSQLFQLHADGSIWRHNGTACSGSSCPGWIELDNNPQTATIAAGGSQLFQLHADGSIWRHNGKACSGASCPGWQELDNNRTARAIAAGSKDLFELHSDGSIWRYTGKACNGTSCLGWEKLDNNSATTAIAAAGKELVQLHNDGSIWLYAGTPCAATSCPGWQKLDNNPATIAITDNGTHIYQRHNDGSIWHYTGPPCTGTSCPGWTSLDDNPRSKAIAAGGFN